MISYFLHISSSTFPNYFAPLDIIQEFNHNRKKVRWSKDKNAQCITEFLIVFQRKPFQWIGVILLILSCFSHYSFERYSHFKSLNLGASSKVAQWKRISVIKIPRNSIQFEFLFESWPEYFKAWDNETIFKITSISDISKLCKRLTGWNLNVA
jgi:hypothetical protein